MRISDWSSDVCSSDLHQSAVVQQQRQPGRSLPWEAFGKACIGRQDQFCHKLTHGCVVHAGGIKGIEANRAMMQGVRDDVRQAELALECSARLKVACHV